MPPWGGGGAREAGKYMSGGRGSRGGTGGGGGGPLENPESICLREVVLSMW